RRPPEKRERDHQRPVHAARGDADAEPRPVDAARRVDERGPHDEYERTDDERAPRHRSMTAHHVNRKASAAGRVRVSTLRSAPDASVAASPNVDGHMKPIRV